jgi:hypothetical protein
MANAQGIDPLLKAVLPTRILRRHGQSPPGSSPYDTGARSHASCKHSSILAEASGRKGGPPCRWRTTAPRGRTPSASSHPAWRPRPTRHVTGVPVTTCKQPHRHLRQCRASSTAGPVPRPEATPHMAQQCQSSTTITCQSAVGGGVTVDMAKSGTAVMAAADERKQRSNRLQARVPS